jgi:ectoine hydroxylase
MQLSSAQIELFRRDGYLFFHRLFSDEELAVLRSAMREILGSTRPSTYTESSEDAIRMLKGMHLYNETILRLSLHPKLVRPCEQLLGSGVYVHQTRMVLKEGLKGPVYSGFPWHQDYSTFIRTDGMREPRAIIIAIFLDDVTACNAPLMMIPGSHKHGLITNRSSDPDPNPHVQLVIEADLIREMAEQAGVVAHLGPAGSVVMMDVAMVHGSTENISPMSRTFYYLIYNSVENKCADGLRDEYHACNDFGAITPLTDDCLLVPSPGAQS